MLLTIKLLIIIQETHVINIYSLLPFIVLGDFTFTFKGGLFNTTTINASITSFTPNKTL
jgi:hypothetical protein